MLTFVWDSLHDIVFTIPFNTLLESSISGLRNISSAFLIKLLENVV